MHVVMLWAACAILNDDKVADPAACDSGGGVEMRGEAADLEQAAALGTSMAVADFDGDGVADIASGAPQADGDRFSDAGQVFVLYPPAFLGEELSTGDTAGALLGRVLAAVPDRTGDGLPELLLGAPGSDEVAVLLSPFGDDQKTVRTGPLHESQFGASVAAGAEIELIGAPLADGRASAAGAAYATNWSTGATTVLSGESFQGGEAGVAVLVADLDADGVEDLVIGADHVGLPGAFSGATYVVFGPSDQDSSLADAGVVLRGQTGSYSGFTLAGVDDDADGRTDLFVGALGHGGKVYLVSTISPGTWDLEAVASASIVGDDDSAVFGAAVAVAAHPDGGDVLLVGDPLADDGSRESGAVWIFRGPFLGESATASNILRGDSTYGQFGFSVALGVDGDEFTAAVGAPDNGGGLVTRFGIGCVAVDSGG